MRILQTVFQMLDYGGIVNYVELLTRGLREEGHDVDVVILRGGDRDPYTRQAETSVDGAYKSLIGTYAHVTYGWYGIPVYSYGSKHQLKTWRKLTQKYDLIIHQIPVPEADPRGYWRRLYQKIDADQILVSHDAHFPDRYPHMLDIAEYVKGIAAVNPASFWSLEHFPVRRVLIGSPHRKRNWTRLDKWEERPKKFGAAHVWKPWKHMEKIVEAIPHLRGVDNWLGGDGIEARYMRSKDKCKPKYKGIWKRALKAGMNYDGFVTPAQIRGAYADCRVMVDLSYSKKFTEYGCHVNRSTMEAYNAGVVPLLVAENMVEREGVPRLFSAGETHLLVGETSNPKEIAREIKAACNIKPRLAREIVENGRELLTKHWTYQRVTQHFLELARGDKKVGIYRKAFLGVLSPKLEATRDKYLDRIISKR